MKFFHVPTIIFILFLFILNSHSLNLIKKMEGEISEKEKKALVEAFSAQNRKLNSEHNHSNSDKERR